MATLSGEHICEACHRPLSEHAERAACGRHHWPPLCCPECPCGSFVNAHIGYADDALDSNPHGQT